MQEPINIFIAYSSKDEQYLKELRVHLEPLKLYEIVDDIWFDGKIVAGQIWEVEIKKQLESASIILLMLSPDFLYSHYCRNEMVNALERHEQEEVTVIPIIARPCSWQINPDLKRIEVAVKSQIISTATFRDELYVKIIENIVQVANRKRRRLELSRLQVQEDQIWINTKAENNLSEYQNYIKTYPNGKYIQTAEKAIQKIEEKKQEDRLLQLQQQETAFWEKCQTQQDISIYRQYLKKYPNGRYTRLAEQVIRKIEMENEEQELAMQLQQEDLLLEECKKGNSISSYQSYLTRYPNGRYIAQVEKLIKKIEKQEQEQFLIELQGEEVNFWKKVQNSNKISSYETYLKEYPNGKYASTALTAIQTIRQKNLEKARAKDNALWHRTLHANNKEVYEEYLDIYPNGLHHLEAKRFLENLNVILPEMVFVEGGFLLKKKGLFGITSQEISIKNFLVSKYLITNELYAIFLNNYGSDTIKEGIFSGKKMIEYHERGLRKEVNQWQFENEFKNHPVVYVSWYGAYMYCKWLSNKTGKMYQLPDENYWEYAARGGKQNSNYEYSGSTFIDEVCWYRGNTMSPQNDVGTLPVGLKKPNELGIYDMSGNVWEWCENPKRGGIYAMRGGSWCSNFMNCNITFQQAEMPDIKKNNIGFRVLLF